MVWAEVGDVVQLHAVAQVGAVGAVLGHRLVVFHVRDRVGDFDAEDFLPDPPEQAFHDRDDVLAIDERHLHVELRELGLPVGTRVFVAEAADDLHVLVAAADHQQLLEKLRRLRQRIEAAGHQARRDDEIARAFRRRFGEERRFDFPEAQVAEVIAHDLGHAIARAKRLLHLWRRRSM